MTLSSNDNLVTENIAVNSKLKLLEDQLRRSWRKFNRLYGVEGSHDDLDQYTRKFNLMIHGILEREEDNVENVINLGKILKVNLTRGDIDIVHRLIIRFSNYNAKSQLYKAR